MPSLLHCMSPLLAPSGANRCPLQCRLLGGQADSFYSIGARERLFFGPSHSVQRASRRGRAMRHSPDLTFGKRC